ncbi:F-box protein At3g07870-like [Castanea sativa]|uniref:F-box protein At3g07870-like n=1 Tax=Castanea sativa TaxID=21020 RepID=UPI003F650E30
MSDNLPELTKSFTEDLHNEEESILDSLPPEILPEILIRLPTKAIIKCTSVCKSWKSLIQTPTFISDYLRHSATKNDHPLLLFRLCSENLAKAVESLRRDEVEKEVYALHWDDNMDFSEHTRFDFPFHGQSINGVFRVVGTCNGLVCLADDLYRYCYNFIIWNPCIRKFVQLPRPHMRFSTHGGYDASVGFGFDSKSNDYKVVRFVSLQNKGSFGEFPPEVEVYSLATGEWRILNASPPEGCVPYRDQAFVDNQEAFVNGALHWVALRRSKEKLINFVMVFDLGDEVFREIALPNLDECALSDSIWAYGNSLALIQHSNLWVMKEYANASSWTKILSLADQGVRMGIPRPLGMGASKSKARGFRKSGEVIVEMADGQLISRDLKTEEIKDLGISGYGFTFVGSYVESLALLDNPNQRAKTTEGLAFLDEANSAITEVQEWDEKDFAIELFRQMFLMPFLSSLTQ